MIAAGRLAELWVARSGRISMQVLSEYFVTVTRKLDPGLTPEEAWDDIEALYAWKPQTIDMPLLSRSFAIQRRYQLSWWDSMIVAAYFGITVENPFAEIR